MSKFCCDERDVGRRVEAGLGQRGEDLELVAEAPVADLLAREVGRRGDAGVLEATPAGCRGAGRPGRCRRCSRRPRARRAPWAPTRWRSRPRRWRAPSAARCRRHPRDLDVEALRPRRSPVDGGEVAGELRLGEPLQLQLDVGAGRCRAVGDVDAAPPPADVSPVAGASLGGRVRSPRSRRWSPARRRRPAPPSVVGAAVAPSWRRTSSSSLPQAATSECQRRIEATRSLLTARLLSCVSLPCAGCRGGLVRARCVMRALAARRRCHGTTTYSRRWSRRRTAGRGRCRRRRRRSRAALFEPFSVLGDLAAEPVLRAAEVLGDERDDHGDRRRGPDAR